MATTKAPTGRGLKAFEKFDAEMDKKFGDGVFETQDTDEIPDYEVLSTGSLVLDVKLGTGGWVVGRVNEVWGPEGAGKTMLCTRGMIEGQKRYLAKRVGYINVERRADKRFMQKQGLDLKRTTFVNPNTAEEVSDAMRMLCGSGLYSVVVLDSVGALISKMEQEKEADEATVAQVPKIVTRMLKQCAGRCDDNGTIMLVINQQRALIGGSPKGPTTTTGGGFALKHGTTTKLSVKRGARGEVTALKAKIDGESIPVGHFVAVKIERNSVALAGKTATFAIIYQETEEFGPMGIDNADEAAEIGILFNLFERAGAWFTLPWNGERYNGRPALVEGLRKDPVSVAHIRQTALDLQGKSELVVEQTEDEDAEDGE